MYYNYPHFISRNWQKKKTKQGEVTQSETQG